MPYNPGITYDTTSVANGISNAGNSLAQGFDQFKQNQLLASQATAKFEGTLAGNPEILSLIQSEKAPSDVAAAYNKLTKGGAVDMKSAALLSTFADSVAGAKQKAQQQQMQDMQLQQAQLGQAQQAQANERAKALSDFAAGRGVAGMSPQAQAAMQAQAEHPVGQYISQVYNYTGRAPDANNLTEFAKSAALLQQRGAKLQLHSYKSTGENGEPVETTVDEITGRKVGEGPIQQIKYVNTPEEAIQIAGATKAIESKAASDNTFLNNVTANAESAQSDLAKYQEAQRLYKLGVQSGFGQDFAGKAIAFADTVGLPVDKAKLGDRQYLQSILAQGALAEASNNKGQGAFSDNERKLLATATANYQNTPEGNLRILNLLSAVKQRHIDMEFKRQELVDKGEKDPAEFLKRWSTRNPVQSYLEKMNQADKHASAADSILSEFGVKR